MTSTAMMLQWGHDFSAVEIAIAVEPVRLILPLQWGHDFSAVEISSTGLSPTTRMIRLQWGHDFSAVEIIG